MQAQTQRNSIFYAVAMLALAAVLLLLALPWLTIGIDGDRVTARGIDLITGTAARGEDAALLAPSMTFILGLAILVATLGFALLRRTGGASMLLAGTVVSGCVVAIAVAYTLFAGPGPLGEASVAPASGLLLAAVAFVAAFFAAKRAAPERWREGLPQGIAPYFETAPLGALALGISSGFPYAMIGATLTTRLSQDGITKSTVTAFALAFLVYNLKWLWAWVVDGVKIPVIGRLGQRVSWLIVSAALVIAAVINLALCDPNTDIAYMALSAVLVGIAGSTFDIVIDAYRIEILEPRQLGVGSGMSQYGWRIGSAGAGAIALVVAARAGWETAYIACAALALPAVITGLIIGEPARRKVTIARRGVAEVAKSVWGPFAQFFMRKGALLVLLFILVHKIGDTLSQLTVRLLFDDLGFTNDEIAFYDVGVGFLAYLVGIFVGGFLYARMGMKHSVLLSLVLMAVSNISFAGLAALGHSNAGMAGAMFFENFASGFGGVVVVAYFSALTDLRYTAAQYALISAAASIVGRFISGTTAGAMIESIGFVNFYLFTFFIALPGVALFWWMIRTGLVDQSIGSAGVEGEGDARDDDPTDEVPAPAPR